MIFTQESARKLLEAADVFFGPDDECQNLGQTLDLSDVWELACADGEVVTDEELPEVAELFWSWGWAGILYWVSKKDGRRKSEFLDNNRMIEFVRNEEKLREEIPDNNKRAYHKLTYTLEDLEMLCDEKQEDIMFMLDIIRSIYARAGEDPEVARLCNLVLTESRITINAT